MPKLCHRGAPNNDACVRCYRWGKLSKGSVGPSVLTLTPARASSVTSALEITLESHNDHDGMRQASPSRSRQSPEGGRQCHPISQMRKWSSAGQQTAPPGRPASGVGAGIQTRDASLPRCPHLRSPCPSPPPGLPSGPHVGGAPSLALLLGPPQDPALSGLSDPRLPLTESGQRLRPGAELAEELLRV